MDIETASSIEISSSQEMTFTQPKYHFGQFVEDKLEKENGMVIGMLFCDDDYVGWEYTLFYPDLGASGRNIRESGLETIIEV